jgi:hypothetical protein
MEENLSLPLEDPDRYVDHGNPTNPFRLQGTSPYDTGVPDKLCSSKDFGESSTVDCHATVIPDPNLRQHQHNFPGAFENGVCFDCHDPHGDTSNDDATTTGITAGSYNDAMIQREVVFDNRWEAGANYGVVVRELDSPGAGNAYPIARFTLSTPTPVQSDYVKNDHTTGGTGTSGVCEVCHDSIKNSDGTPIPLADDVKWFRRNNADKDDGISIPSFHDPSQDLAPCASCHSHETGLEPGGGGFIPPIWCECTNICHVGVGQQFAKWLNSTPPNPEANVHNINYDDTYVPVGFPPEANERLSEDCGNGNHSCLRCHDLDYESTPGEANHMDGTVWLRLDPTSMDQIDGPYSTPTVNSPSAFSETGQEMDAIVYGNIMAADPLGAWCGTCHDGSGFTWFNDTEPAPDKRVSTLFKTTGHGATPTTAGSDFTRYEPNDDTTGRASCTACHNYHGSPTKKAMVERRKWNAGTSTWDDPFPYPDPANGGTGYWDEGVNPITFDDINTQPTPGTGFADNVVADKREVFCMEACHLTVDSGSEFYTQSQAQRPNNEQGHFVLNYGVGGDHSKNVMPDYDEREDSTYYLVSKAVGFVLGGDGTIESKYVADWDVEPIGKGEQITFNEGAQGLPTSSPPLPYTRPASIWTGLGIAVSQSDATIGRAICVTCHDPHGTDITSSGTNTWGNILLPVPTPNTSGNQMLRDRVNPKGGASVDTVDGDPFSGEWVQCEVCHPAGAP